MSLPAIDAVASLADQQQWIAGDLENSLPRDRNVQEDPVEYESRIEQITASPYWDQTRDFLNKYIQQCIFMYAKTEKMWWSVTVGPRGSYVRVNIGPQEVLTINPWGNFNLHIVMENSSFSERERGEFASAVPLLTKQSPYTGVDNQVWVESNNLGFFEEFFRRPAAIDSARALNMRLMGVRRNTWARAHCFGVITQILEVDTTSTILSRGNDSIRIDNAPQSIITQIERMVWMRNNVSRFSRPVKLLAGNMCAVSGIETPELLEACHIKPWRESDEIERLNPDNGICLASHIHKCFDPNLMGSGPDGTIEYSPALANPDRSRLNLGDLRISLRSAQIPFVELRYQSFLQGVHDTSAEAVDAY